MKRLALPVLWPAFLAAGVLEALVFAVVDPAQLHWFGGPSIGWTPVAVYSVTFLIFWSGVAGAGALTALLLLGADQVNAGSERAGTGSSERRAAARREAGARAIGQGRS